MAQFNIQPTMVFPSTKMESVNKLITEGSLTRLINKLDFSRDFILRLLSSEKYSWKTNTS